MTAIASMWLLLTAIVCMIVVVAVLQAVNEYDKRTK